MRRFFRLLGCILLFWGLIAFLSPNLRELQTTTEYKKVIEGYELMVKEGKTYGDESIRSEMERYNEALYASGQTSLRDVWSYEENPLDIPLADDLFGYVEIPAMALELPLYLGASTEHMSKGAAVLGQSSMPVGGENTNCVIAGHRGYQGIPFFREIERLREGDTVLIHGPWETLEYTVSEILVIQPSDIDAVRIQPGQDMVTLMTCHPYMSHGKYRYLVYCHRSGTAKEPLSAELRKKAVIVESSETLIQQERIGRKAGAAVIMLLLALLLIKRK